MPSGAPEDPDSHVPQVALDFAQLNPRFSYVRSRSHSLHDKVEDGNTLVMVIYSAFPAPLYLPLRVNGAESPGPKRVKARDTHLQSQDKLLRNGRQFPIVKSSSSSRAGGRHSKIKDFLGSLRSSPLDLHNEEGQGRPLNKASTNSIVLKT